MRISTCLLRVQIGLLLFSAFFVYPKKTKLMKLTPSTPDINMVTDVKQAALVFKYILENGMTILVRQVRTIPKVSLQIWYNVGSKDEKSGEKGIAHFIEHMIFKGTKELLSESDINDITHMLSGSCNAFTSYDYTGYLFNMPTQHWKLMLPIMADCMLNARFDEQMISSEMKAVIQELKMYKDRYVGSLIEEMVGSIFPDHPYHYPIIGYKQDLWNMHSDMLHAFYKKHYWPNNATLVVVGDVDPQEVVALAKEHFGHLVSNEDYKKEIHYHNRDIVSKSVTLYRDVVQPIALLAFVVPGVSAKQEHVITALEWILGKGKGSRLYQKLVNELQLVTSLDVGTDSLFDNSLFFIAFEPKEGVTISEIEHHIINELQDIAICGPTEKECERAAKQMRKSLYSMLEDMEQQAYAIGQYFVATGDENYVFTSFEVDIENLCEQIKKLVADHFKTVLMHRGAVLPIPGSEKQTWVQLQNESDAIDAGILATHERTTDVEPSRYAKTIAIAEPDTFNFPKPQKDILSSGLSLLYLDNANTPKINIILSLRARGLYDPEDQQGISNFMNRMLTEGTKNYTDQEFAHEIESRGMSFSASPGYISISLLRDDLPFALDMLNDVLQNATFDEAHIEKIRTHLIAEIKNFWDEPRSFSGQLIKERIYAGHPNSKNSLGSIDSIKRITRDDLCAFYKKYMSPDGAYLAIVGDIGSYNIPHLLEEKLGAWTGPDVEKLTFPPLKPLENLELNHPINRDQVVLAFVKPSIRRLDPLYDKLLLFNQIFGGGALGSMSSRLFQLRERSGLFYTINGSLLAGSDEEPGMFLVKTIVSRDRLAEAEKVIRKEIDTAAQSLSQQELDEAKRAVIHSLVDNFESNSSMAATFLSLERFGLPANHFDMRAQALQALTVEDVQQAVKDFMHSDDMLTVRIGRIDQIQ